MTALGAWEAPSVATPMASTFSVSAMTLPTRDVLYTPDPHELAPHPLFGDPLYPSVVDDTTVLTITPTIQTVDELKSSNLSVPTSPAGSVVVSSVGDGEADVFYEASTGIPDAHPDDYIDYLAFLTTDGGEEILNPVESTTPAQNSMTTSSVNSASIYDSPTTPNIARSQASTDTGGSPSGYTDSLDAIFAPVLGPEEVKAPETPSRSTQSVQVESSNTATSTPPPMISESSLPSSASQTSAPRNEPSPDPFKDIIDNINESLTSADTTGAVLNSDSAPKDQLDTVDVTPSQSSGLLSSVWSYMPRVIGTYDRPCTSKWFCYQDPLQPLFGGAQEEQKDTSSAIKPTTTDQSTQTVTPTDRRWRPWRRQSKEETENPPVANITPDKKSSARTKKTVAFDLSDSSPSSTVQPTQRHTATPAAQSKKRSNMFADLSRYRTTAQVWMRDINPYRTVSDAYESSVAQFSHWTGGLGATVKDAGSYINSVYDQGIRVLGGPRAEAGQKATTTEGTRWGRLWGKATDAASAVTNTASELLEELRGDPLGRLRDVADRMRGKENDPSGMENTDDGNSFVSRAYQFGRDQASSFMGDVSDWMGTVQEKWNGRRIRKDD